MRNTNSWRKDSDREFARLLPKNTPLSPREFSQIELGLYLLEQIAPKEPASSLWVLLTGYKFDRFEKEGAKKLFNARQLLGPYKSRHVWLQALKRYFDVKESIKGFDVSAENQPVRSRGVAFYRERFNAYEKTLTNPIPFREFQVKWANPGTYKTTDSAGESYGIKIPNEASQVPPIFKHNLNNRQPRQPITVTWSELIETARWMDETEVQKNLKRNYWEHRMVRNEDGDAGVQLETFNEKKELDVSKILEINGITHIVGMISSGKSTLMDVLTVWAARNGRHVTLVVGDVISAINRARLFFELGLKAAPILGSTRRLEHLNNLNKSISSNGNGQQFFQSHPGFRWLSTACPLDGMRRDENPNPFPLEFRPCDKLRPVQVDSDKNVGLRACPLFSACPYHQAQIDLVDASIWIATPASLVHTRVAQQINSESVRFMELVSKRSDLVVVDEADRVQIQLDNIFSPNQVLCSSDGEGWLDNLEHRVGEKTSKLGRTAMATEQVEFWRRAHHQAQLTADAVYKRLLNNQDLRDWIRELHFFTDLLLFDRLAIDISGDKDKGTKFQRVRKTLDVFVDQGIQFLFNDRLLDEKHLPKDVSLLVTFASRLLLSSDSKILGKELRDWVLRQSNSAIPNIDIETIAERLEFALLIAILSNRLNTLLGRWKEIEEVLGLEHSASTLLYRPPLDYQALIPTTPIGNVLAFQFQHVEDASETIATLKFIRCAGVGRWLLLHLHELFAGEGSPGPNVLLLSGTSWAGGDPSYHIQVPVSGVLKAPVEEVEAIAKSQFYFTPLKGITDESIKVSGLHGEAREDALRQMLKNLIRPTGLGQNKTCKLEKERDSLEMGRQRVLLVVGSYKEAELARKFIEKERPNWRDRGEVMQLVPDKGSDSEELDSDSTIPRGNVDQFASTTAWLLIAPLMAIERGHNILNEDQVAAISAVYFLVRPHPRPQDISYAIRSLNKWAVDEYETLPNREKLKNMEERANLWRKEARQRWRKLLTTDLIYSNLERTDRNLLTWNLMVSIWQIIGRLVRGGKPAKVYFCDAKFDPVGAGLSFKDVSLLDEMKEVLAPYFKKGNTRAKQDNEATLVRELYGPLYHSLINIINE
jgi:hypothetical protein